MSTDAAELVVKCVQVFAQQPHHLHAEIAVLTQKLQEILARNEGRRSLVARLSRDPILFPCHTLAQPEHGSRTDDLQKLPLAVTGRQQDSNLAALHQVNTRDRGTLLKQRGSFGEPLHRFDCVQGLQQVGTQFTRRGLRRHDVTLSYLSLILP